MRITTRRAIAFLTLAAAIGSAPASAVTLFQSIPTLDANPQTNGFCSSCDGRFRVYDAFNLTQTSNVESVTFAATGSYNFSTGVTLSFHESVENLPASQIAAFQFDPSSFSSVSDTGAGTTLVTLDLPTALQLSGGTTYWLSFFNPSRLAIPAYSGGGGWLVQASDGVLHRRGASAGFLIDGSVASIPEPSTWAMMLVGFGGVGFAMRRAKKADRKMAIAAA